MSTMCWNGSRARPSFLKSPSRPRTMPPKRALMTESTLFEEIARSADALRARVPASFAPRALVILGSGLGGLADEVEAVARIPYAEIPGWAGSTVVGHAGRLHCGTLGGVPVLMMQGRLHFYEGHALAQATFPIRVARALG